MTKITKIQVRRDLAINWTTNNPQLDPGEFGFESDTGKLKVGNESRDPWDLLGYIGDFSADLFDQFTHDIIPNADATYNLGSPTNKWDKVYISENSLHIGDSVISYDSVRGYLQVNSSDVATRSDLETVTSANLNLETPTRTAVEIYGVVPATLPDATGTTTQSGFNEWTVNSLVYLDTNKARTC